MRWRPLGEAAVEFDQLDHEPWATAEALLEARVRGVIEACPAYDALAVHFDPETTDESEIVAALGRLRPIERQPRRHQIPACYSIGEDLGLVAAHFGLAPDKVVDAHRGETYTCAALGFAPGFAYLGPLPAVIRGFPRREAPRVRVPAGSVAIAADQTAVYPTESPGGWALIARCPLVLVDETDAYFPIRPGDEVRFVAIDEQEFEKLRGKRL